MIQFTTKAKKKTTIWKKATITEGPVHCSALGVVLSQYRPYVIATHTKMLPSRKWLYRNYLMRPLKGQNRKKHTTWCNVLRNLLAIVRFFERLYCKCEVEEKHKCSHWKGPNVNRQIAVWSKQQGKAIKKNVSKWMWWKFYRALFAPFAEGDIWILECLPATQRIVNTYRDSLSRIIRKRVFKSHCMHSQMYHWIVDTHAESHGSRGIVFDTCRTCGCVSNCRYSNLESPLFSDVYAPSLFSFWY